MGKSHDQGTTHSQMPSKLHTSGTFNYVDIRATTQTRVCARAHTHTHKHTDTRTRIHTQTHAHTHPIVYTGRRGGKRSVRFSSIEMKKLAKINSHLYKETYLTTDFLTSRMSISHSTFRGTG